MNISGNKFPHNKIGSFLRWCMELVQTLFPILLITLLLLVLIETVFKGSVSSYLNLNDLLVIVIIVGIIGLISAPAEAENEQGKRLIAKNLLIITSAGIGGAVIIWYKTQEMGGLSYVISVVGGGLIMLLPMLIWRESEGEKIEKENSQSN